MGNEKLPWLEWNCTVGFIYGIKNAHGKKLLMASTVTVDKAGRMVIPKKIRKKLGLAGEGVVTIEVKGSEVVLKRSAAEKSPSKAISKMNLPVGPWRQVEKEIEEGAIMEQ